MNKRLFQCLVVNDLGRRHARRLIRSVSTAWIINLRRVMLMRNSHGQTSISLSSIHKDTFIYLFIYWFYCSRHHPDSCLFLRAFVSGWGMSGWFPQAFVYFGDGVVNTSTIGSRFEPGCHGNVRRPPSGFKSNIQPFRRSRNASGSHLTK